MGIVRERTSKAFEINDLAHVTKAWLDYYIAVNKEYILSESSVRMPISDYLAQYPGEVVLEKNIDAFKQRKFDLFFERNCHSNYFEFKYVQPDYTNTIKEKSRYLFDLLRLKTKSNFVNTSCYLVICGSKKDFTSMFSIPQINKGSHISTNFNPFPTSTTVTVDKFYKKLFDFRLNGEKYIDFDDSDIVKMKKEFLYGKQKYILSDCYKHFFPNYFDDAFFRVKTTCVSLLYEETSLSAIGIWKIEDGIA